MRAPISPALRSLAGAGADRSSGPKHCHPQSRARLSSCLCGGSPAFAGQKAIGSFECLRGACAHPGRVTKAVQPATTVQALHGCLSAGHVSPAAKPAGVSQGVGGTLELPLSAGQCQKAIRPQCRSGGLVPFPAFYGASPETVSRFQHRSGLRPGVALLRSLRRVKSPAAPLPSARR
jgi:hypothetical protein